MKTVFPGKGIYITSVSKVVKMAYHYDKDSYILNSLIFKMKIFHTGMMALLYCIIIAKLTSYYDGNFVDWYDGIVILQHNSETHIISWWKFPTLV